MFLVNNLGNNHHRHGTSSSEGSGSDSGSGYKGFGSDGPSGSMMNYIDFKALREAFRSLDTENLGMLNMSEVKQAF